MSVFMFHSSLSYPIHVCAYVYTEYGHVVMELAIYVATYS